MPGARRPAEVTGSFGVRRLDDMLVRSGEKVLEGGLILKEPKKAELADDPIPAELITQLTKHREVQKS